MLDRVTVKRTSRLNSGHLWVFSNEIVEGLKNFSPGSIVSVYDRHGVFYGKGYINPSSLITVRIMSKIDEPINEDFFRNRINNAYNFRKNLLPQVDVFRLIHSESDFLPGLIVDVYNKVFVVQFLTLGIERYSEIILKVIDELFSPEVIVIRNDSPMRKLEGLTLDKMIKKGKLTNEIIINDNGMYFAIDPLNGQKTGFFLDQRFNRYALPQLLQSGDEGLDLFCYSGAWGIHTLKKASKVIFVDSSQSALDMAKTNVSLNKLNDKAGFIKADAFSFLKQESKLGKKFDFVILDPPAFVKNKTNIKEAIRGYREINSLAMTIVKSGGMLSTSTCSHHIDRSMFVDIIFRSSRDANRQIRILEFRSHAIDHPVLMSVPETEYLKCLFLQVL